MRYLGDRRKDELKRRLSSLGSGGGGPQLSGVLRMGKLAVNPAIDAMLRTMKVSARLEALLEQTELEMTVAQLLAYMGIGGAARRHRSAVIGSGGVMFVDPAACCSACCRCSSCCSSAASAARKLSQQLPDALEMMARSLRAGHALSSSFKMVATEMPTPV